MENLKEMGLEKELRERLATIQPLKKEFFDRAQERLDQLTKPRGSLGQLEEIAKMKQPDLTAADLDAAVRTIAGSARSMGVDVEGV